MKLRENALRKFVLQRRLAPGGHEREERHGSERGRHGTYIRARSVVEGRHDFIEESKIEFLVKVENAFHLGGGQKWLKMRM